MARYKDGVTGAFSGKVGPVVGSSWNGIPYIRSKGNARATPISATEQANWNKFSAAHAWLQPLLPLLRVGFNGYSRTSYGYNAAKSYVLKYTMEAGKVIPARVKISAGDLILSPGLTASITDEHKLQINWSPEYISGADGKDQLMALAYHPEDATAVYVVHGAFRETGEQVLDLPWNLENKTIHVYAAFIAADRSRQSDSMYFGPLSF